MDNTPSETVPRTEYLATEAIEVLVLPIGEDRRHLRQVVAPLNEGVAKRGNVALYLVGDTTDTANVAKYLRRLVDIFEPALGFGTSNSSR